MYPMVRFKLKFISFIGIGVGTWGWGVGGKPRRDRDFCTFSAPLPLAHTHTFNLVSTLNNVKERFSSLLVFTFDSLNLHVLPCI